MRSRESTATSATDRGRPPSALRCPHPSTSAYLKVLVIPLFSCSDDFYTHHLGQRRPLRQEEPEQRNAAHCHPKSLVPSDLRRQVLDGGVLHADALAGRTRRRSDLLDRVVDLCFRRHTH